MRPAGEYTSRVRFERQSTGTDDGTGNPVQSWAAHGSPVWARIRPRFGSEQMAAGRLESTATAIITVRKSAFSSGITPADRISVTAGPFAGTVFSIRSIIRTMDGSEIEFACEEGKAHG